MSRRSWLSTCGVAMLACFAGGIGLGFNWARNRQPNPVAPAPSAQPTPAQQPPWAKPLATAKPHAPTNEVTIEKAEEIQELLTQAGLHALVFKYPKPTDSVVRFRAEIEVDGTKRDGFGEIIAPEGFFPFSDDSYQEVLFLWVRDSPDVSGKEHWRIVCRVTARERPLGDDPLNPAPGIDGRMKTLGTSTGVHRITVPIWNGRTDGIRPLPPLSTIQIPTPLPMDREVCIAEIRGISHRAEATLVATAVSALGSPVSFAANPLPACALLNLPRKHGICTIRLMCRLNSTKSATAR